VGWEFGRGGENVGELERVGVFNEVRMGMPHH
jgi:hypothetical protein